MNTWFAARVLVCLFVCLCVYVINEVAGPSCSISFLSSHPTPPPSYLSIRCACYRFRSVINLQFNEGHCLSQTRTSYNALDINKGFLLLFMLVTQVRCEGPGSLLSLLLRPFRVIFVSWGCFRSASGSRG